MKKTAVILAIAFGLLGYVYSVCAAPPNPQPQGRPVVQTPQPVKTPSQPTPVQRPVTQPTIQRPASQPSSTVTKPSTPQIQRTPTSTRSQPKPTFATTPTKAGPTVTTTQPLTKPTASQPVKPQFIPAGKLFPPSTRSIIMPGAQGSVGTAVVPKTTTFSGAKGVARSVTKEKQATPVAIRQNVAVATPVVAKKVTDNVTAKTNQLKSATPAVKTDSQKVTDLVLQYTNVERVKNGLPPLKQSPALTELASFQSNSQAAAGIMAHDSNKFPTGWATFNDRAAKVDFGGNYSTAENVTQAKARAIPNDKAGQEAYAKQIIDSWMNSPKHKENILSPKSQYLGVGLQDGYATQIFGSSEGKLKVPLPTTNSGVKNAIDNVKDKTAQSHSTTSATKGDGQKTKTGGASQLTDKEVGAIGKGVGGALEKAGFNPINSSSNLSATSGDKSKSTSASVSSSSPTLTTNAQTALQGALQAHDFSVESASKSLEAAKQNLARNANATPYWYGNFQKEVARLQNDLNQTIADRNAFVIQVNALTKQLGSAPIAAPIVSSVATGGSTPSGQTTSGDKSKSASAPSTGAAKTDSLKTASNPTAESFGQLAQQIDKINETYKASMKPVLETGDKNVKSNQQYVADAQRKYNEALSKDMQYAGNREGAQNAKANLESAQKTLNQSIESRDSQLRSYKDNLAFNAQVAANPLTLPNLPLVASGGSTPPEQTSAPTKTYGTGTTADPFRDYPDAKNPPYMANVTGTGTKADPLRSYSDGDKSKSTSAPSTGAAKTDSLKTPSELTDKGHAVEHAKSDAVRNYKIGILDKEIGNLKRMLTFVVPDEDPAIRVSYQKRVEQAIQDRNALLAAPIVSPVATGPSAATTTTTQPSKAGSAEDNKKLSDLTERKKWLESRKFSPTTHDNVPALEAKRQEEIGKINDQINKLTGSPAGVTAGNKTTQINNEKLTALIDRKEWLDSRTFHTSKDQPWYGLGLDADTYKNVNLLLVRRNEELNKIKTQIDALNMPAEVQMRMAARYKKYASQYEDTANKIVSRLSEAVGGREFTAADAVWLEKNAASDALGGRGEKYNKAPDYIKKEQDSYEKFYKSQNVRDFADLIFTNIGLGEIERQEMTPFGQTTPFDANAKLTENRYKIEANRAKEFSEQLRKKAKQAEAAAEKYEAADKKYQD